MANADFACGATRADGSPSVCRTGKDVTRWGLEGSGLPLREVVSVLGAASAPIPSLFQATLALTPNGAARLARCPFPRRFETGRGWWPFTGIQCPYETKTARYTGMEGGQKKNSYSLSAYWAVISEFGGGSLTSLQR